MISNRELQFVVELMKELNKMLGIEIRLSTTFYLQIDELRVGIVLENLYRV